MIPGVFFDEKKQRHCAFYVDDENASMHEALHFFDMDPNLVCVAYLNDKNCPKLNKTKQEPINIILIVRESVCRGFVPHKKSLRLHDSLQIADFDSGVIGFSFRLSPADFQRKCRYQGAQDFLEKNGHVTETEFDEDLEKARDEFIEICKHHQNNLKQLIELAEDFKIEDLNREKIVKLCDWDLFYMAHYDS